MDRVVFPATVDVATAPNTGRLVLGVALLLLSAVAIVWGLVSKRYIAFSVFFLLAYALFLIREGLPSRAIVPTQATLEVQETRLMLRMPGTKLEGGKYITQVYLSELDDMDAVGFLNGQMMLRSRLFTSVGVDGTQVVSNRRMEMCEVTVGVDPTYWGELQELLSSHGVQVFC